MPNVFQQIATAKEGKEGEGVFKNEDCLGPDFLPEILPGRENEVKEIARLLQPLCDGRKASNLFLCGPPGVGKTACARFVLRDLREFEKTLSAYINCWLYPTRQAVLVQFACEAGVAVPRRGISGDEVFTQTIQGVKASRKTPLVVLDECDRLFYEKQESVLYDFLRAGEVHGIGFNVVLISNDASILARIDSRMRSSLQSREIFFKKYLPAELKKILAQRAEAAFFQGACGKEVIALCAAFAARKGGDARVAIQALWRAGKNAEARGAQTISLKDAQKAVREQETLSASQEKRLVGLSAVENAILNILREKGELSSGELYALVGGRLSERSLREYVSLLEAKRLVATQDKLNVDGRGRTRLIKSLV